MTKEELVAYFDPQEGGFYWAKPTTVTAPITVDVEPLPSTQHQKDAMNVEMVVVMRCIALCALKSFLVVKNG